MALTPEAAVTALSHAGALPASAYANVSLPYRGSYPSTYVYSGEFPANFVWGLGTAAYQIEGGWDEGGKGPSIWDTYSGSGGGVPSNGMVAKGHSGAVACDHFHRWKEDVQLMVSLGLKNYRFSISWPRVMPNGTMAGGVNEAGVQFYSDLIDELLAHDIQPYVTLYHWDLPQSLQTAAIPGWLDLRLVEHFGEYAKLCFERFGDRVKFWSTFNEPWTFTVLGYGTGSKAPGGQFAEMSTNPYLAGHTVLLAHARAVRLYRSLVKARAISSGAIGISNNCDYREPATAEADDIAAAQRANIWWLGWFADPIFGESGDYPIEMRQKLGTRLPSFTAAEKAELKGSADWFGLNHYGSGFAKHAPNGPQYGSAQDPPSYWADFESQTLHTSEMPKAASTWLYSTPWGLRKLLGWISHRYPKSRAPIYVTENGWSTAGGESTQEGIADDGRVAFYANYTSEMRKAINEDGVDVRGYFGWSLMDNFEWEMGYTERFGLVYTDYQTQQRTPKASAKWFAALIKANALVDPKPFLSGHAAAHPLAVATVSPLGSVAISAILLFVAVALGLYYTRSVWRRSYVLKI